MKNYIAVTTIGKDQEVAVFRLAEITTPPQDTPFLNSASGQAQELACKLTITQLSKIHAGLTFSWGHEEKDGRTWLHGVAENGVYRSI